MPDSREPETIAQKLARLADEFGDLAVCVVDACHEYNSNPDLSPGSEYNLGKIRMTMQFLNDKLDLSSDAPVAEKTQTKAAQEQFQETKATAPDAKRRRFPDTYNFALLETFAYRDQYQGQIGHTILINVLKEIDPNINPKSVRSKISRWKNDDDKKWVTWVHPERLSLTPKGQDARNELRTMVQGNPEDIETISKAIRKVLRLG